MDIKKLQLNELRDLKSEVDKKGMAMEHSESRDSQEYKDLIALSIEINDRIESAEAFELQYAEKRKISLDEYLYIDGQTSSYGEAERKKQKSIFDKIRNDDVNNLIKPRLGDFCESFNGYAVIPIEEYFQLIGEELPKNYVDAIANYKGGDIENNDHLLEAKSIIDKNPKSCVHGIISGFYDGVYTSGSFKSKLFDFSDPYKKIEELESKLAEIEAQEPLCEIMAKTVEWTPNDYSPTYNFDVDENGNFIRLNKVFDLPNGYKERKEIAIEQHYIDYMSGDGFEKYKSYIKWISGYLCN